MACAYCRWRSSNHFIDPDRPANIKELLIVLISYSFQVLISLTAVVQPEHSHFKGTL